MSYLPEKYQDRIYGNISDLSNFKQGAITGVIVATEKVFNEKGSSKTDEFESI